MRVLRRSAPADLHNHVTHLNLPSAARPYRPIREGWNALVTHRFGTVRIFPRTGPGLGCWGNNGSGSMKSTGYTPSLGNKFNPSRQPPFRGDGPDPRHCVCHERLMSQNACITKCICLVTMVVRILHVTYDIPRPGCDGVGTPPGRKKLEGLARGLGKVP
jgi:hypothetical protein